MNDDIKIADLLILSKGITIRGPYPTQEALQKVRDENPGADICGGYGCIYIHLND